jgi:hypothetical protein
MFLGVVQVAGCSVGKPPISEVDRIEASTARIACVGELSRWHREFYYQPANFGVDKGDITVIYVEAGHLGKREGRYIIEPPTTLQRDDANFAFAGGIWDRASGGFKEWICGCNSEPSSSPVSPPICASNVR